MFRFGLVETVAILLIAGAVLLMLETVLPGMIAGTAGLVCLAAAVILSYKTFSTQTANVILLVVIGSLGLGTMLWLRYFPQSRMAKHFISEGRVGDPQVTQGRFLDHTGRALTALRPSGAAAIDGQRVDVVTEGPHLAKGTPVKVVAVEGIRVVVRAMEGE